MDKMFQLLIVSLFFIVSTTNGLSLPPGNVDSVEATNSSLGEIAETLDVFEKMSHDKNFNASDSVVDATSSDKIDKEKNKEIEDKLASGPSTNNKEDANSTSTTPKTVPTPSTPSTPSTTTTTTTKSTTSASTTPPTSASTPASSSTTITPATVTKPLNSSSATTGLSYNDTVLETAFDSNGTMANEIMSSMDSILHELSSNSSESSSNDLESPSLTSGEFNNYFEELRVLDGLEALFESD